MSPTDNKLNEPRPEKSGFDYFVESIGWLQIVASPLLAGLIIGSVIYYSKPGTTRFIIAAIIVAVCLVIGIIWATKIWRKKGTMNFLSRIDNTSEKP